jgi:beta-lactam-binding protein with PASTA domain
VTITVAKGTATPATDAATTAAPVTTAPTGGATTHTETIKVPDLIGQNVEYAKDQLHDQGFTGQIKTVDQYTDDPDKVGKVLSQDPKAGKQAAKNATFTLKVGKLSPSSGNPSPPAPTVTCTPPKVLVAGQCVAA